MFSEGALEIVVADRFERDPEARRACIDHYGYGCQICGAKMSDVYGDLGEAFIHVHHRTPLAQIRESYVVDPIRDLVPVCPNCHAMLHRGETTLEVDALARIVRHRRR
jgi:5-methylcytosine-specific restriction protein A